MTRPLWVWLDGRTLREDRALIPATDPGFLCGRGVFEVARAYEGVPFRLRDHLARMRRSARRFGIRFRPPALEPAVRDLCRRNGAPDATVRITLSAGGRLLVTARRRRPLPASWYRRGARILIAPWRRDPRAPLAGHKTLSYLENVLAHEEALRRGRADMITADPRDRLLEGCVTNLFLVIGSKLVTPSLRQNILPGVTRKVILEIHPAAERVVHRRELREADEVFLTNSLIEVLPVGRPGPVTRRIAAAYRDLVTRSLRPRGR
jgi:branched-chain amino acid aminotransferase